METVVVGMSGGVDSSVAAALLKKQGYNVIGLFMQNWVEKEDNGACTAQVDSKDAETVCAKLGIPFFAVNFAKEYQDKVFSYFLAELKAGRTPNPDVLCNKEIKFGPFLEYAKKIGADYIATGHYCKIEKKDGHTYLCKSKDQNKDQTYFLNQLTEDQISRVMFPLAEIEKPEVRKIAKSLGLCTSEKKDSTGICFIGERNFKNFLKGYFENKVGDIINADGVVLGKHDGLMFYTIGQSKGLGIGGHKDYKDAKWCVVKKDLENNRLVVGDEFDKALYSKKLLCDNFNFINGRPKSSNIEVCAKIRYRQKDQDAIAKIVGNGIEVEFKEKQRAITPGQFVVLYEKDICLGGGIIDEVFDLE